MSQKQLVYDTLEKMNIPFEKVEHTAVYTIEEMQKLGFPAGATVAKNLFLRDAKGKRHFLIVVGAEQPVNLKYLEEPLQSTKLSFASEERLQKHLGLAKGSVSPFGLLNDAEQWVEFYLDEKLLAHQVIGVHPNDNTATVFISPENLLQFVGATGHELHSIRFPG